MVSQLELVYRAREGGNVRRSHTMPHVGEYTVGKHTFDMLVLLDILHPQPRAELFAAVLNHDLHERWLGDPPSTIKWLDPELSNAYSEARELVDEVTETTAPDLTGDEYNWVKWLDKVEFYMWTLDQINMGNDNAQQAAALVSNHLMKKLCSMPGELSRFVVDLCQAGWRRTDEIIGGDDETRS